MRYSLFLLALFLVSASSPTLRADVISVPGDFVTIQAAIDAAVDGDEVVIADGVYTGAGNRDIDFLGKAITVRSENGNPYACVIDCQGSPDENHRGFLFINDEGPASVLEGVTIRNGYMDAPERGGGVFCQGSSPTFMNCIFSRNTAYEGGGLDNTSSAHVTVIGCIFTGNVAESGGGMASASGSFPTIEYCTFYDNSTTFRAGGGLSLVWCTGWVRNCTFFGNWAPEGSAIDCGYGSSMKVYDSIITFNDLGEGFYVGSFANAYLTHCDIYGNDGGDWVDDIADQYGVRGNISEDPIFVMPDMGDCRLLWGSPCIDTGQPELYDVDETRRDMGASFFDQRDYLTLYLTPDIGEVSGGETLGVTYTLINRWDQSESFLGQTQVILPNGNPWNMIGPRQMTVPGNTTTQQHFTRTVPGRAPLGQYEYRTKLESPLAILYDEDSFIFRIVE